MIQTRQVLPLRPREVEMLAARLLCLTLILLPAHLNGQSAREPDRWRPWHFLVGDWTAEGVGKPGQGTGTFSFHFDLQGRILVRKSRVEYPATQDRSAFTHEDLMVIYSATDGQPDRAIYFDNEGHVIHYSAAFSGEGKVLAFVSDPAPSAPRFRLVYTRENHDTLKVKFEIAPPARPEEFSSYVEGVARREQRR
jgi:hypothetical protein